MNSLLAQTSLAFLVSLAVTYLTVPVSRRIAMKIGAIDYPSNRRINNMPVPRCGGIALYVGFMAALAVVFVQAKTYGRSILDFVMETDVNGFLLIGGITFAFLVGLYDDIHQMRAKQKFVLQIVACCIVFASGVSVKAIVVPITSDLIPLGVWDFPITVIYLLVFLNITNLIDGLDGLAAGLVAIVSSCLLVLVLGGGSYMLSAMCVALIGSCLAFLRFNFYPASVFMGDSGSLFLGMMVGIVSIMGVARTQSLVMMVVPLVMAGVPVLDTTSAIIRRKRQHKHIDEPDLGHIHHRLIDAGLSQRKSVLILYACTAALGIVGIVVGKLTGIERYLVLLVLLAVVFVIIWKFGLFKPVLQHFYVNRGQSGPRVPPGYERGSQIPPDDRTDD